MWACGGQRLALLVFLCCFSLTGLFAFRQGLSGLELAGLARLTGWQDPGVLWSLPLQHPDDRHTQPYRLFYARTKVLIFAWQASFGPSHLPSAGSLLCMVKGRDFDGVRKVLPD